jgi:hypothetical protein
MEKTSVMRNASFSARVTHRPLFLAWEAVFSKNVWLIPISFFHKEFSLTLAQVPGWPKKQPSKEQFDKCAKQSGFDTTGWP